MNFYCMSLFPDMIRAGFETSITGRAADNGLLSLTNVNIRDFSTDKKHFKVDDYPYGGGAGLVMKPDCVYAAYEYTRDAISRFWGCSEAGNRTKVVYMTPRGETFTQDKAAALAGERDLIILCGHYEGIDERVLEEIVTDNISIGDYVLTGGELAALVVMDAVSRFVPGVLGNGESAYTDSFGDGLLEYPQYTRPEEFRGKKVPEVLLSGHHANVDKWRHEQKLKITQKMRPDLYEKYMDKTK